MATTRTYEAVVLKSVDVGEADRFCILFTRQRGRLAARARGVRKPMSRMGGSLLPFSHVRLDLVETERSMTVTSASCFGEPMRYGEYDVFTRLQRGADLALQMTEDDEPLPQVFDLLVSYFHAAGMCDATIPFTLCLLHLLGFLPAREEDLRFSKLPLAAKEFVLRCTREQGVDVLCAEVPDASTLSRFIDFVLADHMKKPLRMEQFR